MFSYLPRCLLFPLLVVDSISARPPVKNLVVFGDSYSDDCNYWRLSNSPETIAPFPFSNCPPSPKGRADTGFVWPEIISKISDIQVINSAFSGATCNNTDFPQTHEVTTKHPRSYSSDLTSCLLFLESYNGTVVDPDVTSQIQKYVALNDSSMKTPEETVAAMFIGTNDLGFFFKVFRKNRTANQLPPGVRITNEADCVVKQVQSLYSTFPHLRNNPPPIFAQYSANVVNSASQPGAFPPALTTQLVSANNALQALQLGSLQKSLPGSDIQIFPAFDLYSQRIAPKAFLGPNGTSTGFCNMNPGPCPDPQGFLFWDDLHPGAVASNQLAAAVVAFLNSQTDVTGPELQFITQPCI